jgi:cytochrome c
MKTIPFRSNTTTVTIALAVILCTLLGRTVHAADRGTADEAKALLQKAVEHYKQVGRAKALEDFTGKKAPWVDRDLYVACENSKHTLIANGAFPSYVGTSLDAARDIHDKPLGQSMWEAGDKGGVQSVEWKWFNPVTGNQERKVSFLQRLDSDTQCSVGYYKAE